MAFALDTRDREVMPWCATTGGLSGEMIRDLMLDSDNGSAYRANETIDLQSVWVSCLASPRSVARDPTGWRSLSRRLLNVTALKCTFTPRPMELNGDQPLAQ